MAVIQNEATGRPMAARAEALGERLGRSLARARRRFERPRQTEVRAAPERGAPERGAPERQAGGGPLVHRADDLVTHFERGFTSYATVLRNRLRRGVARIREEAEDIAAEAAHLRETRAAGEPPPEQSRHSEAEPAA